MNDNDKFDAWLSEAAQTYNEPPARAPREEMWAAIEARGTANTGSRGRLHLASQWRRWGQFAAAAALLLILGYGAGRLTRQEAATDPSLATLPGIRPDTGSELYDAAVVNHFEKAEVLLTTYRTSDAEEAMSSLGTWARSLLTDTRLLLDSPAASDTRQRRLLEDLELTLAQIVQLRAASSPDDKEIVSGAIDRGELLTRLRNVTPRGMSGT